VRWRERRAGATSAVTPSPVKARSSPASGSEHAVMVAPKRACASTYASRAVTVATMVSEHEAQAAQPVTPQR